MYVIGVEPGGPGFGWAVISSFSSFFGSIISTMSFNVLLTIPSITGFGNTSHPSTMSYKKNCGSFA